MSDPEVLETVTEQVSETSTPIIINPSQIQAQLGSGVAHLLVVMSALTVIDGFVGKRDLFGFINWLQSAEALPFLGVVVGAATLVWRQIKARENKAKMVTLGLMAPNSVAMVKGVDTEK